MAFSSDGRWLVSTHGDGAVLLWDVEERRRVADFNEHGGSVRAVAFSRDGKMAASASEDRSVIVWNPERRRKEAVLFGHETRVTSVAFSPDGAWLASCDLAGNTIVWDVVRRQARLKWKEGIACYSVAVSPDGRWLANTSGVYDSAEGVKARSFYEPPLDENCSMSYGLAFSPDGRRLVRGTHERLPHPRRSRDLARARPREV